METNITQSAELKIRITPELKRFAKIQAKRSGMKLSEYIRDLIERDVRWDDVFTLMYEKP